MRDIGNESGKALSASTVNAGLELARASGDKPHHLVSFSGKVARMIQASLLAHECDVPTTAHDFYDTLIYHGGRWVRRGIVWQFLFNTSEEFDGACHAIAGVESAQNPTLATVAVDESEAYIARYDGFRAMQN